MKAVEGEVEINGITIYYRSYGDGDPLLLIQGLGANSDWWGDRFLEPLAEHFRVVTFDNRGAGRSGKPPGPYSIVEMASDTAELINHLGWDSTNVAGLSMGGMIAQELALDYPEKVRKLVLMCTTSGGREQTLADPEIYSILNAPRQGISDEYIARIGLNLLFPIEFINENPDLMDQLVHDMCIAPTPPEPFQAQVQAVSRWSVYDRISELKNPTLIFSGEKDILIPPGNSRILHDLIPGSRLIEVSGAGHGLPSMCPEKISSEIIDFLL